MLQIIEDQIKLHIEELRTQILIHSYLYYFLGFNLIEDYEYDNLGKELIKLQEEYPLIANESMYADEFENYKGICYSGFDLDYKKPEIISEAEKLLKE